MKDQFVTYEIAKKLKELGFNEPCFGIYSNGKLVIEDQWTHATNEWTMMESENPTAPLWQQAIDWLSDKKDIGIYECFFHPTMKERIYTVKIHTLNQTSGNFPREAAILKALELIK